MLRTYSNDISVDANEKIPFKINKILTGKTVSHLPGLSDIVIKVPGYYEVNVNLSGKLDSSGTVTTTLLANDVPVADAKVVSQETCSKHFNHTINTIIKAIPGENMSVVVLNILIDQDIDIAHISLGVNRLA